MVKSQDTKNEIINDILKALAALREISHIPSYRS